MYWVHWHSDIEGERENKISDFIIKKKKVEIFQDWIPNINLKTYEEIKLYLQ